MRPRIPTARPLRAPRHTATTTRRRVAAVLPVAAVVAVLAGLTVAALMATPPPPTGAKAPRAAPPSPLDAGGDVGRALVVRGEPLVARVSPGDVVTHDLLVTNGSGKPVDVVTHGALLPRRSQYPPAHPGPVGDVGGWLAVEAGHRRIGPGDRAAVPVTIAVPPDALLGDHHGVLWATAEGAGGGIPAGDRAGVRARVSVQPARGPAEVAVGDTTIVRRADGQMVATTTVHNRSEAVHELTGELWLTDGPAGVQALPQAGEGTLRLLPGEASTLVIPLDLGLPRGMWEARLTLSSPSGRWASVTRVTLPGRLDPPVEVPWTALGATGGALVLIGGLALTARTLRRRPWW